MFHVSLVFSREIELFGLITRLYKYFRIYYSKSDYEIVPPLPPDSEGKRGSLSHLLIFLISALRIFLFIVMYVYRDECMLVLSAPV